MGGHVQRWEGAAGGYRKKNAAQVWVPQRVAHGMTPWHERVEFEVRKGNVFPRQFGLFFEVTKLPWNCPWGGSPQSELLPLKHLHKVPK